MVAQKRPATTQRHATMQRHRMRKQCKTFAFAIQWNIRHCNAQRRCEGGTNNNSMYNSCNNIFTEDISSTTTETTTPKLISKTKPKTRTISCLSFSCHLKRGTGTTDLPFGHGLGDQFFSDIPPRVPSDLPFRHGPWKPTRVKPPKKTTNLKTKP